jgi:RimJ/RimL family protein N-acetyltransferase
MIQVFLPGEKNMLRDNLLYLRKLEASDLDRTWEWMNTSEIYMIMGVHAPISKTGQLRWFESLDKSADKIVFAVCTVDGNAHIGNVSLDTINYRHRNARLSIFLADPAMCGQGHGKRALTLLLEYAFNFLNLHRVYAKMNSGRDNILKFYQNMGFQSEGKMRQHEFLNGSYIDKLIVSILRHEWIELNRTSSQ